MNAFSENALILLTVVWLTAATTGFLVFLAWRSSRKRLLAENARLSAEALALEVSCPEAILTVDPRGLIRGMNPAAERLFGCTRAEMLGQSLLRLLPDAASLGASTDVDPSSGNVTAEVEGRRYDGSRVQLTLSAGHSRGSRSSLMRIFLTEAARSERLEVVVHHPAEQMVGKIARQFDNLLTTINGYSELALHSVPADNPARKDLEEIVEASDRASKLTRDLLAFSGNQLIPIERVELNAVAQELESEIGDFEVTWLLDPAAPVALTNAELLLAALRSMVQNARERAGSTPRITVVTGKETLRQARSLASGDLPPGDYGCIGLMDSGAGMSSEALAGLFEPFGQLATAYGFARSCAGGLGVKSHEAEGTAFEILFPLASAASPEPQNPRVRTYGI